MATLTTESVSQYDPQHTCEIQLDAGNSYTLLGSEKSLPSETALSKCNGLRVEDAEGISHTFRDLYTNSSQRTLIVFVRHFFCGLCKEYLRTLSSTVTAKQLEALPQSTRIVVVGCGSPELIKEYASSSGCTFPIYADHSRKVYAALGMLATSSLGQKPAYQSAPLFGIVLSSFVETATSGRNIFKSGNYSQIGGEFLFEQGKLVWCHRMRNTRDHLEMPDLLKLLGIS